LSTYAQDFQGGRFVFLNSHDYEFYDSGRPIASEQIANDANVELVVEPRAGRVAIFSSDMENTHQVEQVTGGQRFVLSFWFTCDPRREFEIFLDGNAHIQFGQRLKDSMIRRAQQQSQKRQQASGSPKQPRTNSDL
jgi:predicted 2-oxoglutarate/Fe(II)-dependent dioxygenase YbiX